MALLVSLLLTIVLVFIDQLTKYYAVLYLKGQEPIVLWQQVLELHYHENDGIAFSMFAGWQWLIVPITALVMLLIFVIMWRSTMRNHWLFRTSCILILAGGIGNLIDRTVLGYVVDFIYVRLIDFPIFNVADCCVVIGAALLIVYVLFVYKEEDDLPLRTVLFGIGKREKQL